MVLTIGEHMGIRTFIRGLREEILPETLTSQLEELEELDSKLKTFKVSGETVKFKIQAENDFLKAVLHHCENNAKNNNQE